MNKNEILPSIFGADIGKLKDEMQFLEDNELKILHVDMMDGNYVPKIAFGPDQIKMISKETNLKLDVHLMVKEPKKWLDEVIDAGADMISVHYEATPHIHAILSYLQKKGIKAGVALNPSTKPEVLEYLMEHLDYILVMTINPGHSNQSFIPESINKIKKIKEMIGDRNIQIEVDGGINPELAEECAKAGASMIVVGSYLFSENKPEKLKLLRQAII